jgi:hypothetical protein
MLKLRSFRGMDYDNYQVKSATFCIKDKLDLALRDLLVIQELKNILFKKYASIQL